MFTPIAGIGDYFYWWQLPLVALLVALLIVWRIYRSRQT